MNPSMSSSTPPRHQGSARRPRTVRPEMPHLITALSDTSSSTSSKSPSRRSRPPDAKILRGAQIIRQQLQQQEESRSQRIPPPSFSFAGRDLPEAELSRSVSSDEFSDPWSSANVDRNRPVQAPVDRPYQSRLTQRSRPWNRDLGKFRGPVVHHPESTRGVKMHLLSKKVELTNIQESPALVEQDDSHAWDIDTPPVQSLESYSFPEHGDASQWADVAEAPRPVSPIPSPLPDTDSTGSTMGRNESKQTKIVTIPAEPPQDNLCRSSGAEADSIDIIIDTASSRDRLQRVRSNESSRSGNSANGETQRQDQIEQFAIPVVTPSNHVSFDENRELSLSSNVVSPLSVEYKSLVQNDAYRHAMSAGYLWQCLVGQHVRFPDTWWKGARAPPMGMDGPYRWMYIARHRVQSNLSFNNLVRRRNSSGRLVLHIIVRDLVTWKPVQDIVIGCFHSNARGVRDTEQALPKYEDCREIWMAIRKRCDDVSVVDCLLTEGERLEQCARESPLMGSRRHVTNVNIRVIFGDDPPKRTVFILESELYERLVVAAELPNKRPPALILLQEFFPDPGES